MAALLGTSGLAAALVMLRWNHARVHGCARRANHHGAAKAVGLAGAGLAGLGVEPALANGNAPPPAKVTSGLEVLLRDRCRLLQGRKVSAWGSRRFVVRGVWWSTEPHPHAGGYCDQPYSSELLAAPRGGPAA